MNKQKSINKYLGKKALISYSQISLLILATFAFCFIIWESERGEGAAIVYPTVGQVYQSSAYGQIKITSVGSNIGYQSLDGSSSGYIPQGWFTNDIHTFVPSGVDIVTPQAGVTAAEQASSAFNPNLAQSTAPQTAVAPAASGSGATGTQMVKIAASDPSTIKAFTSASQYSITEAGTTINTNSFVMDTVSKDVFAVNPGGNNILVGSMESGKFVAKEGITGINAADFPASSFVSPSSQYGSTASQAWAGKFPGLWGGAGGWADALISGAQWGAIAFGVGYMIGSMLGMSKDNTMALSTAMAAGAFVGKALYVGKGTGIFSGSWAYSAGAGLIVGAAIFILMYKKEEYKTVEFKCMPWQAPKGGADCEKCNSDLQPCTEYRCKSLGQLCELENKGTGKEMCLSVNIRETDPPVIKPNANDLTQGYKYIFPDSQVSPPSHGFRIEPVSGGTCIKPFTPIKFGINTFYADGSPVPSRCKIDINHTTSFDNMAYWMGGSNLYAYNHTEQFSLPSLKDLQNTSLKLENGKTMVYYIRCESKNDKPNSNPAEYMLRFCIDASPDTTAPEIKATSILSDSCVAENKNSAEVEFYTNEPADCRWSYQTRSYEEMENSMTCLNRVSQMNELMLYTCKANLTGIKREDTKFYIKCKDHPELAENLRNKMAQAYEYVLKSSNGLRINKIEPNGTIYSGISPSAVNLYVETSSGCENGKATCSYSLTGNANDYIDFSETYTEDGIHKQTLYALEGRQTYYIKCMDAGGNVAINTTTVNIDISNDGPIVARAYVANEKLNIMTLRNSECSYTYDSCSFAFDKGIVMPYGNETLHVADLNTDKTYYIKCRDEFTTEPAGCSIVLKPQQLMTDVSLS